MLIKSEFCSIFKALKLRLKPYYLLWYIDFGSVLKCEILNPTYFIAIIYGRKRLGRNNARYIQNIVMIYNILETRFVAEIVCATAVKSVKMTRDLLV